MVKRIFWLLCLYSSGVQASIYSNHLDNGGWQAQVSVFECALVHSVPFFGDAVFATRAGENSHFTLTADTVRFAAGKALVAAQSPIWAEQTRYQELGLVAVKETANSVQLPSPFTERMLAELYDGQELWFSGSPWYQAESASRLAITTVGFRPAYEIYLDCLASLLPVNFDQIKRTAVYFGSNQYEDIRPSELKKLDNIVTYIKADTTVKEFFIDGHTDSVGSREDNLQLAERRAQEIAHYLINKGVPESAIVSRWHGERYPVTSNETVQGRAKNRRVTIRLERVVAPPGA